MFVSLVWLILAHSIGDIALQNEWQSQNKGKKWDVMLGHCLVWTACICVALQFLGIFALWKVFYLVLVHWLVDYWKCKQREWNKEEKKWWWFMDQGLHFLQLIVVWIS